MKFEKLLVTPYWWSVIAAFPIKDVSNVKSSFLQKTKKNKKVGRGRKTCFYSQSAWTFYSEKTLAVCSTQCLIRESGSCMLHSGCCSESSMKYVVMYLAIPFPVLFSLVISSVFLSGLYILVRFSGWAALRISANLCTRLPLMFLPSGPRRILIENKIYCNK